MTEDLISRQAAIDAFNPGVDGLIVEGKENAKAVEEYLNGVIGRIKELPPAQLEPCEDAVSRQRLLSDLKELVAARKKYPVMAEQIKGVETAIGYVKTIPSVTQKPEQRWIPCSERLPHGSWEDLVNVSIHDDSGDTPYDYTSCGWITTDGEYWIVDNEINNHVVAWMPLPEPYSERREE